MGEPCVWEHAPKDTNLTPEHQWRVYDARSANGLKVEPLCSYVRTYLRRHPDQQDLLA